MYPDDYTETYGDDAETYAEADTYFRFGLETGRMSADTDDEE